MSLATPRPPIMPLAAAAAWEILSRWAEMLTRSRWNSFAMRGGLPWHTEDSPRSGFP
ncbi:hypothetical protein MMEU_4115 [Mycobacterium marinum str. Europe]|nr:hypothetical protein MMEU_4115 [Mycobacterium marinum str. Europe]